MHYTDHEVTQLLKAWSDGDPNAAEKLMPLVFDDIRDVARRALAREAHDHTLQPTALVNEVYMRLVGRRTVDWENRKHFFGSLAQLMRLVLVDHARKRLRFKRGGDLRKISLDERLQLVDVRPKELVALDDALKALKEMDPRQAQVVELRYFVGLTKSEIADVLDISKATVGRDWQIAKLWLRRELSRSEKTD